MSGVFQERVPCRFDALAAADGVLSAWLEEAGCPGGVVYAMRLALEELGTNVIKYGLEEPDGHEIEVEVWEDAGGWVMRVTDDGRPFNPLEAATPRTDAGLEEREVGGLGLHLVRRMFDETNYERTEGKNRLVMRKRFVKASPPHPHSDRLG